MRTAIIGLGRAGRVHLAAAGNTPGVDVVAVCEPLLRLAEAARATGIRIYDDVPKMLAGEDLEAAVVCTPPAHHASVSILCLHHDLDVLCEKPLAFTRDEANAMFAAARARHRVLMVTSKFRHVAAVRRVRDLLQSGVLGEPISFQICFSATVDMSKRWNARARESGGGVIIDNGCHAFDIVSFLLGVPVKVHATALKRIQPLAVEDSAVLRIVTRGGAVGNVELSWSLPAASGTYLCVQGSQGSVAVGWHDLVLSRHGREAETIRCPYNRDDAHRAMHEAFREVQTHREPGWITAAESVRSVAAVEAAYRSLRSGRWEQVEKEVPSHQATTPAEIDLSRRRPPTAVTSNP